MYRIPNFIEMEDFMGYISKFPNIDSPEIIGLHPNADLTFRFKEVSSAYAYIHAYSHIHTNLYIYR